MPGVSGRNNKSSGRPTPSPTREDVTREPSRSNTGKNMLPDEAVLKSLMMAGLAGQGEPYRQLLHQLSGHLRGYFKIRLSRAGRADTETEDLLQETLLAIHTRRCSSRYLCEPSSGPSL